MDKLFTATCIIPAKGRSSRLPNKNRLLCAGVPLVERAYRIAQNAKCFDTILLSTDSVEIVALLRRCGYKSLYLRPKQMAADNSPVEDAIAHALTHLETQNKKTDYVCLIHPTSPCLLPETVQNALNMLYHQHAEMLISVCDADLPCNTAKPLKASMQGFLTDDQQRSFQQQYGMLVKLNNAIVAGKWAVFREKKDYYKTDAIPYLMNKIESIDIDDAEDFELAEAVLMRRNIYEAQKSVSRPIRAMQPADVSQDEIAALSEDAGH